MGRGDILLFNLFLWVLWRLVPGFKKSNYLSAQNSKADALVDKITAIIETDFSVRPCSQCNGNKMTLDTISSEGKSISYSCNQCKNQMWASSLKEGDEILIDYWTEIRDISSEAQRSWGAKIRKRIQFAANSYEQNMPANVRGEVWRRD